MKNEIEKILAEYSDGKETLQDATTKVLRLFNVMRCKNCDNEIKNGRESFCCDECKKEYRA